MAIDFIYEVARWHNQKQIYNRQRESKEFYRILNKTNCAFVVFYSCVVPRPHIGGVIFFTTFGKQQRRRLSLQRD